jgi:hypothetical protein
MNFALFSGQNHRSKTRSFQNYRAVVSNEATAFIISGLDLKEYDSRLSKIIKFYLFFKT